MNFWNILSIAVGFLVVLPFFCWVVWRALRRSEDPGRLIGRLVITGVLLAILILGLFPVVGRFDVVGAATVPFLAAIGIMIAIIWAPSWASMLINPLTGAIDGGVADGELKPQYSIAEARRSQGKFREAVTALRKELERFPNDLQLQLMLAEIQAEHLDDLQGAEAIILRISQQKHSPANIASVFQKLADWHLRIAKDPDSARQALERIIEIFPGSQFAQIAAQRIAHLSSVDQLLDQHELPRLKLGVYERDLGLKPRTQLPDQSTAEQERAKEIAEHLQQHPLDAHAREELAKIYAEHYRRVDLAIEQLEQLIACPNQKARDVIHWLELSADFHIKYGNDAASAEATLRRVLEMFPESAGAEMVQRRLATLNQELNRNKKSQAIKLGSYEKDIGLKARKPTGSPRVE